ncbi:MFS transporter [Desulfopila inferna]|uniref:MFS transporter n=1 Tax=Desulfopila inferna TaxID=468528 RepID=UPI001963E869|nr:MFS transporter [Desulfopila inferna]MBM9604077.1 MFS transporter [Desulfopila inferna]
MKGHLSRQIILGTLCKLLLNIGRRFVYPFAPALSRGLDVPLTAITSIIATTQITSLVGLFSGPLADRTGYRFMMQAGLATLAMGMLLCGLAPVYWVVFLGLVLASFGKILFDPALQAFIGKNVPYSKRARAIGTIEISWAGSTLMGIPLLGLVIEYAGLGSSFYIIALLGFVGWVAIGKVFPADKPEKVSRRGAKQLFHSLIQLFKIRPAAGMLAFGFWISLANDNLFVVYGAWFEHDFNISLVSLGFSTVAIGVAELLGEFSTAAFSDRLGLKRSIIIGLVLAITAYLLLPIIGTSLPLAMVAMFFVFFSFEYTMVTSFSLSTELLPEARATMMAGFYAAAGLGRMVGVLIGGVLWRTGGIEGVVWVSAALTVMGLVSLLWGLKGWKPA